MITQACFCPPPPFTKLSAPKNIDETQKTIGELNRRETALFDQLKERSPKSAPASNEIGMVFVVPEVISSILKLGAVMVLMKAGFMSLCHSLEETIQFWHPLNNVITMCMGGTAHAFSNCLLACGIGVWFGTFGLAAPMSCTSQSMYDCIFLNFVVGGRSATLLTGHGTMFRLMFRRTRQLGRHGG